MIRYDHHFNQNEWFVITSFVVGILVVRFLPKRFSKQSAIVFFVCGVFFGFFFDQTLSMSPVSFYDIGDTSHFEVTDFLSQCMYGPYGYLFFYFYDRLTVRLSSSPLYILAWALISAGVESLAEYFGVFHYKRGYNIYFSFSIYLVVLSAWVIFFHLIKTSYGHKKLTR